MKALTETDKEYICEIQAPCFQDLSLEEIALIRAGKTQILFHRGENLTKQGVFASSVLFIISGYARLFIEGNNGRNLNLAVLVPGDFAGISSIFGQNKFPFSITALCDTQALLIESSILEKILRQNSSFAYHISIRNHSFDNLMRETLYSLAFLQMNGRVASVLLNLDGLVKEGHDVFPLLSRKDIAEFAGLSTESTVKILKSFEKDGLIQLREKSLTILKPENLKEISRLG